MTALPASQAGKLLPLETEPPSFLAMDADRALYVGLLGKPAWRELGCFTVYVSLGRPFLLRQGTGSWQELHLAVVRPYVPHQIASRDRSIAVTLIEPESLDLSMLPCRQEGGRRFNGLPVLADRVRVLQSQFAEGATKEELFPDDLQCALYGAAIRRQSIDPRIAHVIDNVRREPEQRRSAEDCAREVDLSFSRFLHLFKAETGVAFRPFQAWKRARSVLRYVAKGPNLTEVALDGGYPDSTHFSHSIKKFYGLRPRDILSGSRSLELIEK